jgi:hypothetical protein
MVLTTGGAAPHEAVGGVLPRPMHGRIDLNISPSLRTVRRAMFLLVLGLSVASALAQVAKYQLDFAWPGVANLFDANQEGNVPTLYSVLALGMLSFLLAAIAVSGREEKASSPWIALSVLFALAAIDEAVSIHELLNDPLRSLLRTGGLLSYPWILVGAVLAAVVMMHFRRFVGQLPPAVRRLAVAGVLLFAAGSLVVESVENLIADETRPSLASALVGTLSELCEMSGLVLILEALLLYIARQRGFISIVIRPRA